MKKEGMCRKAQAAPQTKCFRDDHHLKFWSGLSLQLESVRPFFTRLSYHRLLFFKKC